MGGINDPEDMARYLAMGARYLSSGSDQSFFMAGAEERMEFLRNLLARNAVRG